ncbi:Uncharacterised protein [Mycobacterium tuberculosis]|nr:Uncharacterised protein [Mycobacterium tuberculosis]
MPNFAPVGRSAIGDGRSGLDAASGNRISAASSSSSVVSGSLLTPEPADAAEAAEEVSATRIRPEYEVRRHSVSMVR